MTTYTPTPEAVEAAARAICENSDEPGWSAVVIARAALTVAGPIIAAEVREHVAREIEARVRGEALLPDESTNGRTIRILREDGLTEAASIARGEEA